MVLVFQQPLSREGTVGRPPAGPEGVTSFLNLIQAGLGGCFALLLP